MPSSARKKKVGHAENRDESQRSPERVAREHQDEEGDRHQGGREPADGDRCETASEHDFVEPTGHLRQAFERSEPHGGRRVDFFFNDAATTEIYTLSLHDALPI